MKKMPLIAATALSFLAPMLAPEPASAMTQEDYQTAINYCFQNRETFSQMVGCVIEVANLAIDECEYYNTPEHCDWGPGNYSSMPGQTPTNTKQVGAYALACIQNNTPGDADLCIEGFLDEMEGDCAAASYSCESSACWYLSECM